MVKSFRVQDSIVNRYSFLTNPDTLQSGLQPLTSQGSNPSGDRLLTRCTLEKAARDQGNLVSDFTRLGELDPIRRSIYERGVANAAAFKAELALVRPTTEKTLPGILAAKNMKCLRRNLSLAEKFYRLTSNTAEMEDVYSQLIHGLTIYCEHQQNARPSTAHGPSAH